MEKKNNDHPSVFKKRKILFAVFVISTQMAVIFILKTAGRLKI